jgi:uncharacterized phage protein gp47/JayE
VGTLTSAGWTVDTAATWAVFVRDAIDGAIGTPLDYVAGTWEGAITEAAGVLAQRVDEGIGTILDSVDPRTARGVQLDRIGAGRGITRRAGSGSRASIELTITSAVSPLTIAAGALTLRDPSGRTWVLVDPVTVTVGGPADVGLFECSEVGPVDLGAFAVVLDIRTPIAGLTTATYTPGPGSIRLGLARETDAEYRARILSTEGLGRTDGRVRDAILALTWIEAVSMVRTTAGSDQEAELAATILGSVAFGIATAGTQSEVVELPDGSTDTIRWSVGTDLPVVIVATLDLASGYALADVSGAVTSAIETLLAGLNVGSPLRVLALLREIGGVIGVDGATITLDGTSADVVPLSTELVISGGITVTT